MWANVHAHCCLAGGAGVTGDGANAGRVGDALEVTSLMLMHACRIRIDTGSGLMCNTSPFSRDSRLNSERTFVLRTCEPVPGLVKDYTVNNGYKPEGPGAARYSQVDSILLLLKVGGEKGSRDLHHVPPNFPHHPGHTRGQL